MSALPHEQLMRSNGYHPAPAATDFLPAYLHQLHGGFGPRPKASVVSTAQSVPVTARQSSFDQQMEQARNKRNKRNKREALA